MSKYAILDQLKPSPEQMPAVLERGNNIVVTAGAGTGKTRTLVSRFLSLLCDGMPLRSIVAITFTIKAAREMRNRIREEIRLYLLTPELVQEEIDFWRKIYENLDSARISTIHSFAADIIRQHPAELGLDPGFELIDDGLSARLKSQAVEAALSWAAEDKTASVLFPAYGDWHLRRTLSGLLNRRLELVNLPSQNLWSIWEPLLIYPMEMIVEDPEIITGLGEILEYEDNGILQKAAEAGDLLVDDLVIVIDQWKKILAAKKRQDWAAISRYLGKLRSHLKQKGRKANWEPADPRSIIKQLQPVFEDKLPGTEMDLMIDKQLAEKIVPGLLAALDFAVVWYQENKEKLQGLDFDDLEAGVLTLFEEFPDTRLYWQEQIEAILVDEYQDTNSRQRSMINALNGDRDRLFIVGDGKQSIYRFRGADVAVFRQEKERISMEGSSFALSTSYRAHTDLIENLNGLLEPILGNDLSLPWVEPFSALESGREGQAPEDLDPYVELHLAVGSKADGAGRTAARGIARRIHELVKNDEEKDPGESCDYGDMAVLCRAANSFGAFEEAFEEAGIPYLTISGQGFYDRPEIRDLINALRVIADPGDDLSVAGLLRSPMFAVSDVEIYKIRKQQLEEDQSSLIETIRSYQSEEKDLATRLERFLRIVDKFAYLVDRISISDLLTNLVDDTGYLSLFYFMGENRAAQNIKKLISDAEQTGVVAVTEYLSAITELKDVSVREGEAQGFAEGAVQIMTVHQAKGMEFPVVILGDISKKNRQNRDILVNDQFGLLPPYADTRIETDPDPHLVTGSSMAYELALTREREYEDAESRRLFYVAATRAKDLLILSGVLGRLTQSGKLGRTGGWLGYIFDNLNPDLISLDCELDGNQIRVQRITRPGFSADLYLYDGKVDFDYSSMPGAKEEVIDPSAEFKIAYERLTKQKELEDKDNKTPGEIFPISRDYAGSKAPARMVGDVVHRALQIWKFPSQNQADFDDWAKSEFKRKGITSEAILHNGIRRVINLLERFQDHELYEQMHNADSLLHEVPYSIVNPAGGFDYGVIDALFLRNGLWHLVEFKSDQIRDDDRFNYVWTKKDYQAQVERYLDAVEGTLGQRPEGILCFLNYADRIHLVVGNWDKTS